MRIRDRQNGKRSASSLYQGREQRAQTFRKIHRVGEYVTGRFIKRDASGMSWISFDGLPLLTKLDSTPRAGEQLYFVLQALDPDIILRQTRGKTGGGSRGQAHGIVDFDAARTAFETAARQVLLNQPLHSNHEKPNLTQRRDALFTALSQSELELYLLAANGQTAINTFLADSGSARFFYIPWLLPFLRCDLILRSDEKEDGTVYQDISFGFDSPNIGPGQIRILSRSSAPTSSQAGPNRTGVRLLLEKPTHLSIARAVLTALSKHMHDNISLLGAEKSPQYAHGGVLSQLLAPDPHKLIGLGSW